MAGAGLLRGVPLAETAATAANLAVASVPEGLPFLVSAAQLAAARRLAEHGALVRNPRTIEALGRVDVLCFDKTGTLTEGKLLLAGVGDGAATGTRRLDRLDDRLRLVAGRGAAGHPRRERIRRSWRSRPTGRSGGAPARPGWRSRPVPPAGGAPAGCRSSRPAATTRASGRPTVDLLLSVKGAPETVLPRCVGRDARTVVRSRWTTPAARSWSGCSPTGPVPGNRILAVAECPVNDPKRSTDADVRGLTFVGFLALADGVRESAAPAVRRIRQAGVHTIMITGDHPATAEAIAATISEHDEQRVVTAG